MNGPEIHAQHIAALKDEIERLRTSERELVAELAVANNRRGALAVEVAEYERRFPGLRRCFDENERMKGDNAKMAADNGILRLALHDAIAAVTTIPARPYGDFMVYPTPMIREDRVARWAAALAPQEAARG